MADLSPYYDALQKADAAGDTAGAKQLADYIRSQAPSGGHSFDSTSGGIVPTGSQAAIDARSPVPQPDPNSAHPVTSEVSAGLENLRNRVGSSFADLGLALRQKLGLASYQDVLNKRELDAPMNATLMGKVGGVLGGAITTAPLLAIPGANTVAGAGLIGAVAGALQPAASTREAITNPLIGAAVGASSQYVGQKVGQYATDRLTARAADQADQTAENAVRDATLKDSQAAGYVVPPATVNDSAVARGLESVSGKDATAQVARVKNQAVTDRLVRQDLNIPARTPLTPDTFEKVRAQAGTVYNQVKQQSGPIAADNQFIDDITGLVKQQQQVAKAYPGAAATAGQKIEDLADSLLQQDHSGPQLIEYSKMLRNQAKGNFTVAGRTGDPEARALAQAQWDGSAALEDLMKRNLVAQGKGDLANEFDQARTTIAKAHSAEMALNEGQGHIDAKALGRQLGRGVPLSGGFATAARFAQAFGKVSGIPQGSPGVSKLTAVAATEALMHGKLGLAAALAASSPTRAGLLSQVGQRALATPNYAPSALGTLALKGLQQAPNVALPLGLQAPRLAQGNQ